MDFEKISNEWFPDTKDWIDWRDTIGNQAADEDEKKYDGYCEW